MPNKNVSKILCIDFDLTISNVHTHNLLMEGHDLFIGKVKSHYYYPLDDNTNRKKPFLYKENNDHLISNDYPLIANKIFQKYGLKQPVEMKYAIQSALEKNIKVFITTCSLFPEIIKPTLINLGLLHAEVEKIDIIAGFSSQMQKDGRNPIGKQEHIALALEQCINITITPDNVCLVDDNPTAIEMVKKNGMKGVLVPIHVFSTDYFNEIYKFIGCKTFVYPSSCSDGYDSGDSGDFEEAIKNIIQAYSAEAEAPAPSDPDGDEAASNKTQGNMLKQYHTQSEKSPQQPQKPYNFHAALPRP